jgi:hypothetical protein
MRSQVRLCFSLALALAGVGAACSYDPHPKDGQEACSLGDRLCPYGYWCASNNLCYSNGHGPTNSGAGGSIAKIGVNSANGGNSGAGGVIGPGGGIAVGGAGAIPDSAGGPPAGGAVGTGGATICTPNKATGSNPLIDDMADGDNGIIPQDGRTGGWYTYSDNTGTVTPATPSSDMMCASGSGFSNWGAGLGVNLDAVLAEICTYDASIYSGIRFTIKGSITDGKMRFIIQTADTADALSGGTCVSTRTPNSNCNDAYGVDLIGQSAGGVTCQSTSLSWPCGPATGTAGPVTVTVPFSYMSQEGWGQLFPTFNPKIMTAPQWQFKNCTGTSCYTDMSFNICVGNVSFY